MEKLLVTGGTGLVGSSIDRGIKLNSKTLDLRSWEKTNEYFYQKSSVYHGFRMLTKSPYEISQY